MLAFFRNTKTTYGSVGSSNCYLVTARFQPTLCYEYKSISRAFVF